MNKGTHIPDRSGRRHRRGSIYLLVLGASMLVFVLGVSAVLLTNVEYRAATTEVDTAKARSYARSGMELALLLINTNPGWRTTLSNSNWPEDFPIGDGTYTIAVTDEIDGMVAVGAADPILVTAIGRKGEAVQKIQVKLVPHDPAAPLDALNYGMHSGAGIIVNAGKKAVADRGRPMSSNTTLVNNGTINGDVVATVSVVNNGTIWGRVTSPDTYKDLPQSWVFDVYREIATPLASPGIIDLDVLAPGLNPWGQPNSNGVYFIDAGSATLIIRNSRIHGTLVVRCSPTGRVRIEGAVRMDPYNERFPALIVDGDVELAYTSDVVELDEQSLGANFNPPGAPYHGNIDTQTNDTYECEINGLVHVRGQLLMEGTAEVDGVVICESPVTMNGDNELNFYDDSWRNPPLGYTFTDSSSPMLVVPGSWKHIAN